MSYGENLHNRNEATNQRITMTKPLLKVLAGQPVSPPPIWLMRQAGRYLPEYQKIRASVPDFLSFCKNPKLAVEASLQPIRRYDLDGSIIFSDILIIPEALGCGLRFVEGEGPQLDPVQPEDIDRLYEDFRENGLGGLDQKLSFTLEALSLLKPQLPETTTMIGFAGAPWTLAAYMIEGGGSRDFGKARRFMMMFPDSMKKLIDILAHAVALFLEAQIKAGAEVVQIFDSWSGVLDAQAFEEYVIDPTRKIVRSLRDKGYSTPIIGFPRGAGVLYPAYIRKTRVTAVSVDYGFSSVLMRDQLQNLCPVQGNLDPFRLLGPEVHWKQETDRLLADLSAGPYIFNLGHGVDKDTDPQTVAELVKYIRRL